MKGKATLKDIMNCGITDHRTLLFIIEYMKDLDAPRAAVAVGFSPNHGNELRKDPKVAAAVEKALQGRLEAAHVDADWVLSELIDNHYLARQRGELSQSNSALNLIAKHGNVDAFAAEKIELAGAEEIKERLMRGRKRMNQRNAGKSFV